MNTPVPMVPDLEEWGKTFQRWWATAASVVGTLAAALEALRIPSPWANGLALAIIAVGLGASLLLYRRQARQQLSRAAIEAAVTADAQIRPTSAAFRGLRRFRAGEQLPGASRRRAAASLLAEVQRPSFELAIVTGDSGAGKSSLLECALVEALERAGYVVELVTDLGARLSPAAADAADSSTALTELWQGVRAKIGARQGASNKPVVLILDQLEELLLRLPVASRDTLGDQLRQALAAGWRIVIGLRKEFLAELKEVAVRLGRPLSFQDTFILRNFDAAEAAEVIRECSARDGINIDDSLPELIATDLTVDGTVRPPDLQIVCEALQGEMTVDKYRRERRAAGLRTRFIMDTVDLTGDAVLARAVLRELCDIPNNRKRSDPVSAETITARARAGAAGDRATLSSVEGVLESLRRSYVVVRMKEYGAAFWSLIHDYLVEPIKLATEEQATRSGAAAAELDYYLGEVASRRLRTIPLPRLKEIRNHAPPGRLSQTAARGLIVRSMIVGYGKPALLITAVAGVSFFLVILAAADWHAWRPVDPLSHWNSSSYRDRQSTYATLLRRSAPQTLAMKSGIPGHNMRVSLWDLQSGTPLDTYSGLISISKGAIWSYDSERKELSRRAPGVAKKTAAPAWTHLIPGFAWPETGLSVIDVLGEPPEKVVFESGTRAQFSDVWRAVLDVRTDHWKILTDKDVFPSGDDSPYSHWDLADSSQLHAVLVVKAKSARLTVFPLDYSQTILDQPLGTGAAQLLGFMEAGGIQYLSLVRDGQIETHPFRPKDATSPEPVSDFESMPSRVDSLPPELPWKEGWWPAHKVARSATGYLFLIAEQTETVILPFDPRAGTFGPPINSSKPIPDFEADSVLIWSPREKNGTLIWPEGNDKPFWSPHVEIQPTDRVTLARKHTRLLLVHEDNSAQLWEVDEPHNQDRLLASLSVAHASQVRLTNDQQLVVVRQEGGELYGWTMDGKPLGALGWLGSDVVWSAYNEQCKRILLWTREGQRLDWRFGKQFPFYGFSPSATCN